MFNTSWSILLVDDEPDVLQISKAAMSDFTVFGLPVELHTASSKADAIEVMKGLVPVLPIVPPPRVAVAIIDVVMEHDKAGLELCEYIRNDLGNKVTQLFIRTGQPGVAPEREVIDSYDINGYFTKVEATEDKLYSLVKSGCRQYLSFVTAQAASTISTTVSALPSRQAVTGFLQANPFFKRDGHFLSIGNEVVAASMDEAEARALIAQLEQMPSQPFGADNNLFVTSEGNTLLKIAGDDTKAELIHVIKGDWNYMPPEVVKNFLLSIWTSVAARWHQAG